MSSPSAHLPPHNKANLSIQGNLETAKLAWSNEDFAYQHRLVVFTCTRIDNNTVIADFHCAPASAAHIIKHEGHSHINCLYSRATNKWFFIGTDALTAVERMLGVELGESGRKGLRNKFDSYGPITARNSKDNLSDIFALIKNNQRLKPRNVEKGVRIYRWEELTNFLQGMARHIDLRPLDSSAFMEPTSNHGYVEVAGWPTSSPDMPSTVFHHGYAEPSGMSQVPMESFDIDFPAPLYDPIYGPVTTAPQYTTHVAPMYVTTHQPPLYSYEYDPTIMHHQNQHQHQAWHG